MWRRAFASLVLALYWGLVVLGTQYDIDPPSVLRDAWYSATPLIVGVVLSVAVGVYCATGPVKAALAAFALIAIAPLAVLIALDARGHIAPWHEPTPPLEIAPWAVAIAVVPTLVGWAIRRSLGPRQKSWTSV